MTPAWTGLVDDAEARDGVAHGKYYFMLELPPDFSEAIASPTTGNPRKAQLIAEYNDANNYISSSIGHTRWSRCSTPYRPGSPGRRSTRCCR